MVLVRGVGAIKLCLASPRLVLPYLSGFSDVGNETKFLAMVHANWLGKRTHTHTHLHSHAISYDWWGLLDKLEIPRRHLCWRIALQGGQKLFSPKAARTLQTRLINLLVPNYSENSLEETRKSASWKCKKVKLWLFTICNRLRSVKKSKLINNINNKTPKLIYDLSLVLNKVYCK